MIKIIDNREEKKITKQDLPCFIVDEKNNLHYVMRSGINFSCVPIGDEYAGVVTSDRLDKVIEEGDKKVDVKIEIGG